MKFFNKSEMNNLEGLAHPLPHPHILRRLCEHGKKNFVFVLLKSTMRKGKQCKNV